MSNYKDYLKEAKSDYQLYHGSLTSAIQSMEKFAKARGFELDPDNMANVIGFGPAKPSKGKTNRYSLKLYKNGKQERKSINFQVYNRGVNGNTFELNTYIG